MSHVTLWGFVIFLVVVLPTAQLWYERRRR
jgi:hypothetical protein